MAFLLFQASEKLKYIVDYKEWRRKRRTWTSFWLNDSQKHSKRRPKEHLETVSGGFNTGSTTLQDTGSDGWRMFEYGTGNIVKKKNQSKDNLGQFWVTEKVKVLNYLVYDISYNYDLGRKVSMFQYMYGIILITPLIQL